MKLDIGWLINPYRTETEGEKMPIPLFLNCITNPNEKT